MSTACRRCGVDLPPEGRFCANCGLGIEAAVELEHTIADAAAGTSDVAAVPRVSLATPDVVLTILREATRGEYDVHRLVGTGGMSYVFEATEVALQRKVAIKVMVPGLVPDPALRERFKREARTAASLTHPAIIPIHAVRESDQLVYFVMKFIEGRTLETILAMQGALPTPLAQTVVAQIAAGLAYAHRRGVVHRDVKPANILIDEHGFAVVTDFGIAKVDDARRLTGTGSILGTPHYMAPEQFAGQNVGPASDQYALGALAYECLTGAPPFTGATIAEVMKGHLFDDAVPVRSRRPDCPAPIAEVVMRMLAKSPARRFASLEDVGQRLGSGSASVDTPIREALGALARASDPHSGRGVVAPKATALFDGDVPPTLARSPAPVPRPWRWVAGIAGVAAASAVLVLLPRDRAPAPVPPAPREAVVSMPVVAERPPAVALPAAAPRPAAAAVVPTATIGRRRDERSRGTAALLPSTPAVVAEPLARPQGDGATVGPAVPSSAFVRLGSRAAGTALFINGASRGTLTGVALVPVTPGPVRVTLRVTGCMVEFDTTLVARAGDTLQLGTRMRECGP